MGQLRNISVSDVVENAVALRTVNRESEEFQGLVDSIRQKGFFGTITVRERTDSETGETTFEIVDGLHRFTAAKEAGLDTIGADVVDLDDDEVLEAQIMTNIHKVETRPMEYSKQLRRILSRNPLMTEAELAAKLGKSTTWIQGRLGLNKIENETIQSLIDGGEIKLSNAYALAKLPPEEQADWVDRAQVMPPDEFVPQTQARLKEIKEARRKGRDAGPTEFQPVAHLQKLAAFKEELESGAVGASLVASSGVSTAAEGFSLAVAWALHLDPASVEIQRAKDEARRAEKQAAKERRAAEREAAKAAKAAEAAAVAAE
jgi:ParB family chromosome partitioning protein